MELTGIETVPTSAPIVADRHENEGENATEDDQRLRGVSVSPTTTDDAIRFAAKVAVDSGDYDRARALIDLLQDKRAEAPAAMALATVPALARRPR